MIEFNVPPYVGNELNYIKDVVEKHKICGDGEYTQKCNKWIEEKMGTAKALLTTSCVKCTGAGILMLAIPDQEGWHIQVDGKETETYNVDYGFIGVKLDEGSHTILAQYSVPQKNLGVIFSILGVIMIIALTLLEKKRVK